MVKIEYTSPPQSKDYRRVARAAKPWSNAILWLGLPFLLALTFISSGILQFFPSAKERYEGCLLMIGVIILIIVFGLDLLWKFRIKKTIKIISDPSSVIYLDENGYGGQTLKAHWHMRWDYFKEMLETKDFILLKTKHKQYVCIFKYLLSGEKLNLIHDILAKAPLTKTVYYK
jgi:hypothetical protein